MFFWLAASAFTVWESIHQYQSRTKHEGFRYWFFSLAAGTATFCAIFYVFKWVDFYFYKSEPPTWLHMLVTAFFGFMISAGILVHTEIFRWRARWFETRLENERMQKEQMKARLTALQSHIDPHFLFNNLNTLYSLILNDPPSAAHFLEQLAEIYRYILSIKDEQAVKAETEWKMAMLYLDLLKARYGLALHESIEVSVDDLEGYYLPPLSIQQLIENAVKHNRVEEEQPLRIVFRKEDQYLEVYNTRNVKMNNTSMGTGLKNLQDRFSYLTERPCIVSATPDFFSVKLPLLIAET